MKVRFAAAAAQADIQPIYDFTTLENPRIAARIVGAIEARTMRHGEFPLSGRAGVVESTRELVMPRLLYIAVYTLNVEILAVFHAAQDKPRSS
jgi:plasmid stabilization system protein ParE